MIQHNKVVLPESAAQAAADVVRSGWVGQGPKVEEFERALAERFRPGGEAACVSSGTAALRMAINLTAAPPIRIPTYACIALYHAAFDVFRGDGPEWADCSIYPIDCFADSLNTTGSKIVVHTYGVPAKESGLYIEDFTHAPGAMEYGSPCGTFGSLSVISLGATKPLGCGSGGAVLGPSDLIAAIKDRRDYDKLPLRERFNYAWHDIGAAVGLERLKRLDEENSERKRRALRYRDVCLERGWPVQGTDDSTWYRFVFRYPNPEKAIEHFREHGVEVINPLRPEELIHRQLGLDPAGFPNAEAAAASTVSLPNWIGMTKREEDNVVAVLSKLEAA